MKVQILAPRALEMKDTVRVFSWPAMKGKLRETDGFEENHLLPPKDTSPRSSR